MQGNLVMFVVQLPKMALLSTKTGGGTIQTIAGQHLQVSRRPAYGFCGSDCGTPPKRSVDGCRRLTWCCMVLIRCVLFISCRDVCAVVSFFPVD